MLPMKIRPLGLKTLQPTLHLLEGEEGASFHSHFLRRFGVGAVALCRMSHWLPAFLQFLPALYVAESAAGEVLGLISLSQDGGTRSRWRIDQLVTDPGQSSLDVGHQLVHFAINRYGAEGAQTFLAWVDSRFEGALALLKSCGFRQVTRATQYRKTLHTGNRQGTGDVLLREATDADAEALQALYNESLPVEVRTSLAKTPNDFRFSWSRKSSDRLRGVFFKRWVVARSGPRPLQGALELITTDYENYHLNLLPSPGWLEGYATLLEAAMRQVLKSTDQPTLHIKVFDFQPEQKAHLQTLGFEAETSLHVLVRDYWVETKDSLLEPLAPIRLLMGKTSPACVHR